MSNLFKRPDPETATSQSILKALDEIVRWDWQTGYSFAHIVIDDRNLGDGSILYCLRPSWIAEVMNQRIKEDFGYIPEPNVLEVWEQQRYLVHVVHMTEVTDLLMWLLAIPEEVRDEVIP